MNSHGFSPSVAEKRVFHLAGRGFSEICLYQEKGTTRGEGTETRVRAGWAAEYRAALADPGAALCFTVPQFARLPEEFLLSPSVGSPAEMLLPWDTLVSPQLPGEQGLQDMSCLQPRLQPPFGPSSGQPVVGTAGKAY